jgi:hypothetical protein
VANRPRNVQQLTLTTAIDGDTLGVLVTKISHALMLLLALSSLAGGDLQLFCSAPSDPLMSKQAVATREAPAEFVYQGELTGEPTCLLVSDCEVYGVERSEMGGALTVSLGRMAIGAGGCCASGGTHRTVDGRKWKKV